MTKTRIQKAIEWKEQTRQLVMQCHDFRCVKCNDDETVSVKVSELHTHYIQPLNLGGLDTMNNMITLCNKHTNNKLELSGYCPVCVSIINTEEGLLIDKNGFYYK